VKEFVFCKVAGYFVKVKPFLGMS